MLERDSIYVIPCGSQFSVMDGIISAHRSGQEKDSGTVRDEKNHLSSDLLARVRDAVISVDRDEKITFFSPSAEKLYQVRAAEAVGRKLKDVCHYRFLSVEEEEYANKSLEEKGKWMGENIHETSEGMRLYVESNVNVVRDSAGREIGMQAVIHDITDRKELEIALRKKDKMLSEALYSARMFAFEWDPETDQVFRTPQCADILGIRENPTRSTSRRYFRRIHPEDLKPFRGIIKKLTPANPEYSISYRLKRPDTGEYVVIGEKGKAYFNGHEKLIRLAGIAEDITLRKQLEDELKRQKEIFRKLVDTIPVMITIYDPSLETFWFNQEMEKVLGWTEEDIINRNFMELVYPDVQYREMVREYMSSLEPGWRDFKVTARDGTLVESSWSNIRLSDDRQVGIGIDVRKQREAERILEKDRDVLEEMVREKSQEMLRIQQEIDRENRLADIGKLAASVAHELRNPLATINMSSYNLKRKIEKEDLRKHLERINRKTEEANLIIDNLLTYSRLRQPEKESFNLHDKLVESTRDSAGCINCSRGNLILEIEPIHDTMIQADPHQLSEVFSNILNNACSAIEPGKGEMIIRADLRGKNAVIEFRDNGKGIDREHLERIFDPFFTTRPEGTG
ncbi:MAG: PAS domain S-box protein, partial [Candidatus Latescibacteria bacterium]|nr:PAS domain S-box protein [Candidatus Latescibacterota bacterium]